MFYELPTNPVKAKPILQRFLQENLASSQSIYAGGRRRPQAPRGLTLSWTNSHFNLGWQPPQNISGVQGYNIYRWDSSAGGSDNNRVLNVNNPSSVFSEISMPVGFSGQVSFWVSAYSALMESIKTQIIGAT